MFLCDEVARALAAEMGLGPKQIIDLLRQRSGIGSAPASPSAFFGCGFHLSAPAGVGVLLFQLAESNDFPLNLRVPLGATDPQCATDSRRDVAASHGVFNAP